MKSIALTTSMGACIAMLTVGCSHGAGHDADEHGGSSAKDAGAAAGDDAGGGAFAAIPTPAILVANGGSGSVAIIDPATLKVVGSLLVMSGMHPHHVSVSPDHKRVLITATSGDLSEGHGSAAHGSGHGGASASTMIYELDLTSRKMRDVITVEATAHNAAFTPDGKTIVLGMMEHGMIAGHDAKSYEETFSATGFGMPLEVTPTAAGSVLVAESGTSSVAVFDLASGKTTSRFEVGSVPVAAWASGGSNYFVSVEEGMEVRHLVESDSAVTMDTHTIDPGGMPGQAVLTPDGSELWVAVEDRKVIAIFDAKNHDKLAEIDAGDKPHGIAFDPSGKRAFITDEDGGGVLVIDASSRKVTSTIELGGKPNGIVWLSM